MTHRYYNQNNGDYQEFDQPHPRLEALPNWVTVESDEHLDELREDNDRNGRGNLLGSSSVGDRDRPHTQVPVNTSEPQVEFTEPSVNELPDSPHPSAEDYNKDAQPDTVTVDPSKQLSGAEAPDEGATEDTPADASASEPEPATRPARGANKDAWVEWAVQNGADRDEAKAMSKQDLIDIYGD